MQNFISQLIARITEFWNNSNLTQKLLIGGSAVFVTLIFIGLMLWINRTDYKVLYSNLGPEDANHIIKTLQADKVSYQLTDNGKTILVPASNVYDLRIKIAGEGGMVGSGIGFEIFDAVKVGQTDFVQKINYQRALQGELSRTISEFPNVESARVHLVIPQRSLFIEEQQKPSASVVLKLKNPSRKMDQKEVQGMVNMLVMAVEGLDKDHVSITDSLGKPLYFPNEDNLAGLSVTQREYKLKVEQGLERRIDELLIPLIGQGKVIAKVNVDLDFNQKTIRREIYDPNSSVIRSEQRSEETNRGQSNLESGSPDVNFRGDGPNGAVSTQEGTRETRTTNYEINREEQNIVGEVGQINRMTVAVVVDGTYVKEPSGEYKFVPRSQEELDRIRLLVSHAIGFDRARGDTIEVSCIPFDEADLPVEPPAAEVIANYTERLGKPLLNALLAFLFLMLVVRPVILALIRPKVESEAVVEGLEGLPSAEEQLALYETQEEAAKAAAIEAVRIASEDEEEEFESLKHLEDIKNYTLQLAENNIEQSILVLRGWMKDDTKTAISS